MSLRVSVSLPELINSEKPVYENVVRLIFDIQKIELRFDDLLLATGIVPSDGLVGVHEVAEFVVFGFELIGFENILQTILGDLTE